MALLLLSGFFSNPYFFSFKISFLRVNRNPESLDFFSVSINDLVKDTAICKNRLLTGEISDFAGDKKFLDSQGSGLGKKLAEHLFCIAMAALGGSHRVTAVTAPGSEDRVD